MALEGGFAIPCDCLFVIDGHSLAVLVHGTEIVLSICEALIGSDLKMCGGQFVVLGDAVFAHVCVDSVGEIRFRQFLLSGFADPIDGLGGLFFIRISLMGFHE